MLLRIAADYIVDPHTLDLLEGYLRCTVYDDAWYYDIEKGISFGCALSPLMGALYLSKLDQLLEDTGLFYARLWLFG